MGCGLWVFWDGQYSYQAGFLLAAGQCGTIPRIVWEASHLDSCCSNRLWCPCIFTGTAHFQLTSWPFPVAPPTLPKKGHCGQAASISSLEPGRPFLKLILVLVDYCNCFHQVPFLGLGQANQLLRGISPTRNHDAGDLLLKTSNHNLPITHEGTSFFTWWISHCGPVWFEGHQLQVVSCSQDGDDSFSEGMWPGRFLIRIVNLFLGMGARDEWTVPPNPLHSYFQCCASSLPIG